jgi:hypothetical protein
MFRRFAHLVQYRIKVQKLDTDVLKSLNYVGRMMLDSAKVFAAFGHAVPDEYIKRMMRNTQPEEKKNDGSNG